MPRPICVVVSLLLLLVLLQVKKTIMIRFFHIHYLHCYCYSHVLTSPVGYLLPLCDFSHEPSSYNYGIRSLYFFLFRKCGSWISYFVCLVLWLLLCQELSLGIGNLAACKHTGEKKRQNLARQLQTCIPTNWSSLAERPVQRSRRPDVM